MEVQREGVREIELVIWFHAAIHDLSRMDNDDRSTTMAVRVLRKCGVADYVLMLVDKALRWCH